MVNGNPLFRGGWTTKKFQATVINDIWPGCLFFTLVATSLYRLLSAFSYIDSEQWSCWCRNIRHTSWLLLMAFWPSSVRFSVWSSRSERHLLMKGKWAFTGNVHFTHCEMIDTRREGRCGRISSPPLGTWHKCSGSTFLWTETVWRARRWRFCKVLLRKRLWLILYGNSFSGPVIC